MSDYVMGIGAANMDILGRSTNPIIPQDSNPGRMHASPGGVTRNVCENLARLGVKTKLLTALGDDGYADVIRGECARMGIDLSQSLVVENHPSSTYLTILDEKADMYVALSDMSVLQKLDMAFITRSDAAIRGGRLITFDPGLPEAVIDGITARYGGVLPIFADPVSSAYAARLKPYVGRVDTLKPNRMELEVLSGRPANTPEEMRAACAVLIEKGVGRVFVSMGARGCFYMDSEGREIARAFKPLGEMANATGAGDACMAAIIYSYLHGFDIDKTLSYTLAAGIAAITHLSTINPSMSANLIEQIIRERG